MKKKIWLVVCLIFTFLPVLVFLSACAKDGVADLLVEDHYLGVTVDESLRHCAGRPEKPTLVSQKGVAQVLIDLDARGEDCSSKLSKTWETIDDANKKAEELNRTAKPRKLPSQ